MSGSDSFPKKTKDWNICPVDMPGMNESSSEPSRQEEEEKVKYLLGLEDMPHRYARTDMPVEPLPAQDTGRPIHMFLR